MTAAAWCAEWRPARRTGVWVGARPTVRRVDVALLVTYTLLGLFATARVTRLITADKVSQPVRRAVVDRWGPSSWLGYLLHCRWCVSMYVGPPAAAAVVWLVPAYRLGGWPRTVLVGALLSLAFSHGTALLAGLEEDD
jgi:hypothetical protein